MSGGNGKVDLSGLGGRGVSVPILNQKVPVSAAGFVAKGKNCFYFKMKHGSFAYRLDKLIPEYEGLKDDNEDLCNQIEKLVNKIKGLERKNEKLTKGGEDARNGDELRAGKQAQGRVGVAEAKEDDSGLGEAEADESRKEQVSEAQSNG